jgi:hypothetical protein
MPERIVTESSITVTPLTEEEKQREPEAIERAFFYCCGRWQELTVRMCFKMFHFVSFAWPGGAAAGVSFCIIVCHRPGILSPRLSKMGSSAVLVNEIETV